MLLRLLCRCGLPVFRGQYDNNVYAFDNSCVKSRDAYCRLEYPEEIHSIVEKGYARKLSISELVSFYFGKDVNMIQGSW